jgi:hypothetical protein
MSGTSVSGEGRLHGRRGVKLASGGEVVQTSAGETRQEHRGNVREVQTKIGLDLSWSMRLESRRLGPLARRHGAQTSGAGTARFRNVRPTPRRRQP